MDKLREYASFGVPQYWILDPHLRTLEVFGLGVSRPELILPAGSGAHEIPACQVLVVDLDALWGELDRLPDESSGPEEEDEVR